MFRYFLAVLALAAPMAAFEPSSNADLFQVAEISGRERRADTTTSTDAAGVSNTITINYDTIDGSTPLTQTQLAKISEIISDAVLAADPNLADDEFVVFFDTDTGNFQARFVTGADPNVAGSALENDSTALDKTVEGLNALSGSSVTEFIEFSGESEAKINPVTPFCDNDDNSGSGKKGKGKKSERKMGKGKERRRRGSKSSRGSGSGAATDDEDADKADREGKTDKADKADKEDKADKAKVPSNSTKKDKADKEDKEIKAKGTKGNSEDQGSGSGFDARSAGESSKKKAKSSKAPKASKSPKSSTKSPKANSGKGKTNCIQRPAAAGAQSGFAKNAHVAAASGFAIVAVVGAAVGATLYVRKSRTSVVDETSPLIDNVEVEVA